MCIENANLGKDVEQIGKLFNQRLFLLRLVRRLLFWKFLPGKVS